MRVFLVHRTFSRRHALQKLKKIALEHHIDLTPVFLSNSSCNEWKDVAITKMRNCEAVVVYDECACKKSENAKWEIEKAYELSKPIIRIATDNTNQTELDSLISLYHYNAEFDSYFSQAGEDKETLYKMMVESSEQLIQRRQTMNAFFITAIGALMAIAGTLTNFGTIKSQLLWFIVMAAFGIIGLFLCNSWRNLIDNYGKLNAAKFRVILKLEAFLSAQIFAAEWAALGKGKRPKKYQSFTATENLVPLWFAILIFCLILFASAWYLWSHLGNNSIVSQLPDS